MLLTLGIGLRLALQFHVFLLQPGNFLAGLFGVLVQVLAQHIGGNILKGEPVALGKRVKDADGVRRHHAGHALVVCQHALDVHPVLLG